MKDLSIVIVNYNSSKVLRESLASVYSSTHKASFEIFVVDNASTDGSVEMVKNNFPEVKVIANPDNLGFTRANNQALKLCAGRYSMLLNNDTIVQDGATDRLIDFMDANPKCGAAGPKLLNIDKTDQRQGGIFALPFWRATSPKEVNFVTGACLTVKKETIDKVGLMDENLFFYNDDLDWCKRIKNAGWKIYFVPAAEVVHYGGYSSKAKFNRRMFTEGFRGGLYFARKHYGAAIFNVYRTLLIAFFPVAVLGLILITPFQGLSVFAEKLAAYFDILKIALLGPIEYPWKK